MTSSAVPHLANDQGVEKIFIGVRELNCMGARPPHDHPHVYLDMGDDGHFRSHGAFVVQHSVKTYNCLCGWALWQFAEDSADERYTKVAIRAAEAALEGFPGDLQIESAALD